MKEFIKERLSRFPKGFVFPGHEKRLIKALCRTSVIRSLLAVLCDWAFVAVCVWIGLVVQENVGLVAASLMFIFILWPIIARSQRGFENLTHEASHYNIYRERKTANDRLADWLFANWVLIGVRSFRRTHTIHHAMFGSAADPDRKRFEELGLDKLPRRAPFALIKALAGLLPRYVRGYWSQFTGQGATLLRSALCHAAVTVGVYLIWGPSAMVGWLIAWWGAFIVYLPIIRLIAEAEEHRYANSDSEYAATYSNLGWLHRTMIHPHGDSFHLAHHLCPQIPHWRLSTAHLALSAMDDTFRAGMTRWTVFDDPDKPEFVAVPERI